MRNRSVREEGQEECFKTAYSENERPSQHALTAVVVACTSTLHDCIMCA